MRPAPPGASAAAPSGGGPWAGQPLPRREDAALLRGEGTFVGNILLAGMAYLAVLRSPVAHGRIRSIDVAAAREAPGVLDVLTAADLAGAVDPMPVSSREGAEVAPAPVPLLAEGTARFAGEPVAAVVARTRASAVDALDRVEVAYDPLPPLVDARASAEADIELHDSAPGNVLLRWARSRGDVDERFRRSALVVSERFRIPRLAAAPLEPRGCVASHDAAADVLTLWCSSQDPHRPLRELETVLRRPGRCRVIVPDVGGAFGSKGSLAPEHAVAAVAALRLGRPVAWTEDRTENFLGAYQGRGLDVDAELAVAADGRFLALRARLTADLGAYLYPVSSVSPTCAAMMLTGAYDIPAAQAELVGVATNKPPLGPYRGAGRPEATYVIERLADMAARSLGLDPGELRRRNLVSREAFPYRNAFGYTYDSGDYAGALARAQDRLPYAAWRAWQAAARAQGRLIGVGLAVFVDRAGPGLWERARVTIEPSGDVVVRTGSSPHGQGHETTFAQIAGDALGVSPDRVRVRHGDSADVPAGMGTYGSRSVTVGGSAILAAAGEIKDKARRIAAHTLEASPDDLVWHAGRVHVAGSPEWGMTLAEAAAAAAGPGRLPASLATGLDAVARFALPGHVFPFGAYAVVVEVDPDTGAVTPLRIAAVDDAGTLVNPLLAEGQVRGAIAQGLAAALTEEVRHDGAGQPLTVSFLDYAVPAAPDLPADVHSEFQTTPSPFNPLGAKGIGESGAVGVPAAVANAVLDALSPLGVSHADPPYTPTRVWRLLRRTGAPGSAQPDSRAAQNAGPDVAIGEVPGAG